MMQRLCGGHAGSRPYIFYWEHLPGDSDAAVLELAEAILTCYIRQERFHEGPWQRAIKAGMFLALLKRFDTLLAN